MAKRTTKRTAANANNGLVGGTKNQLKDNDDTGLKHGKDEKLDKIEKEEIKEGKEIKDDKEDTGKEHKDGKDFNDHKVKREALETGGGVVKAKDAKTEKNEAKETKDVKDVKSETIETGGVFKGNMKDKSELVDHKATQKIEKAEFKEIEKVKAEHEKAKDFKDIEKIKPEHEKAQQKEIEKVKAEYEKFQKEVDKVKPEHEKLHKEIDKVKPEFEKQVKEKEGKEIAETPVDPALREGVKAAGEGNADHFIAAGQRPDLSGGALKGEADKGKPAGRPTPPRRKR